MDDIREILMEEYGVMERGEWAGQENYDQLPPDELALADALFGVYDEFGPFDETPNIWVTYTPGPENEDASIGVKCENCAFYKSENECMILAVEIQPEGICRFSVIPPGKVNADA
jgi:hypothetical protein